MRLSQADAPPSHLFKSPVRGSAHHSLRGTRQQIPHSESQGHRPLTQAEAELELSNFSLSLAERGDVSTNVSRLPVSSFAPNLPRPSDRPNPKGYCLSLTGLRSSQWSQSSSLAPRYDSAHRSSAGSAQDDDLSLHKSQSSDGALGAVDTHANVVHWSNAQKWGLPSESASRFEYRHTTSVQLDEDTTAGAESTRQWDDNEVVSHSNFRQPSH
jgi:hypothetical protein